MELLKNESGVGIRRLQCSVELCVFHKVNHSCSPSRYKLSILLCCSSNALCTHLTWAWQNNVKWINRLSHVFWRRRHSSVSFNRMMLQHCFYCKSKIQRWSFFFSCIKLPLYAWVHSHVNTPSLPFIAEWIHEFGCKRIPGNSNQ